MSEWKTIDSAPKDGTEILGYDPIGKGWIEIEWADGFWRETWTHERNDSISRWAPLPESTK
jgi:hypothetical protein